MGYFIEFVLGTTVGYFLSSWVFNKSSRKETFLKKTLGYFNLYFKDEETSGLNLHMLLPENNKGNLYVVNIYSYNDDDVDTNNLDSQEREMYSLLLDTSFDDIQCHILSTRNFNEPCGKYHVDKNGYFYILSNDNLMGVDTLDLGQMYYLVIKQI